MEDPQVSPTERLSAVVDLIDVAGRLPASTAVVPGGHRVEDLRLVESARDHGIVDRIVLVGDKDRISAAVDEVGIEIAAEDVVAADGDQRIAEATVELIEAGGVDIVLKGGISTPIINRHMLPLAVRPTVSLATVFDADPLAGGRPMLMTDAGMTTVCNFARLVGLIRNAVDVAQSVMGIPRPRVAVLSANEKQIASLPSTRIGLALARRRWSNAVVCGPLSFDLATDPGSAAVKGTPGLPGAEDVVGKADVLVCPGIDTANVLYKMIAAMNKFGAASLASITVGFPVPYIILSRSDSLETRLASVALCAVYARRSSESVAGRVAGAKRSDAPGKANREDGISGCEQIARRAAEAIGLPLEDICLVIADLGSPTTVTAVRGGKIVDSSQLDTERINQVEQGSREAVDAMADRVAKAVGGAFVAAGCDVEAIVLTRPFGGGLEQTTTDGMPAGSEPVRTALRRRVGRLAPVMIIDSV